MEFDWAPYFGGWALSDVLTASMLGAMGFAPLIVLRLSYRLAFDFVGEMVKELVRR
jgi:hypothetical protein